MTTAPRAIPFQSLAFLPRFVHGDMAEVAEVTGVGDGTSLGTGFARFTHADIPWRLRYDEVIVVLEGRITVEAERGTLKAGPRDCLWLPRGTRLRYCGEEALVFYAITPADWCEEGEA